MTDILLQNESGGLCTLTLNRPEKLNALDTALFERLNKECVRLEALTDTIGCVVLRANGRAFCAAADLSATAPETPPPPTFKPRVLERLSNLPQPLIACVHGACVTGGLELALAADLIVCSASARFADTHGRWGLVGGWGMTQRLPRRIGLSNAKLMMMTGRSVDAAEALRIGLVDLCFADADFENGIAALVRDILANSWHTNRETKKLLIETEGMRIAEGLAHEHYRYPGIALDYLERKAAFNKKS